MPTHPMILLGFVNMKLRDEYADLDDLCKAFGEKKEMVVEKLQSVGYTYSEECRQFVARKNKEDI